MTLALVPWCTKKSIVKFNALKEELSTTQALVCKLKQLRDQVDRRIARLEEDADGLVKDLKHLRHEVWKCKKRLYWTLRRKRKQHNAREPPLTPPAVLDHRRSEDGAQIGI